MIRAFFFDFNQTLVRCAPWIELEVRTFPRQILRSLSAQALIPQPSDHDLQHAQTLFQARRRSANRTGVESSHMQDLTAILRALGREGTIADERLERSVAALHRECLPMAQALPGAQMVLERLRDRGVRLAVISNAAFAPFVYWGLEAFDLLEHFEFCLVSADTGLRKPRRAMFQMALTRMGLEVSQAVHVGDDLKKDIVAANLHGLKTVWLGGDTTLTSSQREAPADLIAASLDDILDWLPRQE